MSERPPVRVGIIGVSGYSGMEMARLVANHPHFRLALAVSDKWAGELVGDRLPVGGNTAQVKIRPQSEAPAALAEVDLAFLCTPADASLSLAAVALEAGCRVVDLSGAFRLGVNEYPRWYGFVHPDPELLARACYAIPEACTSGDLREARLVSNPGCYATASALATLALLRAGVIEKTGILIDAKSGMTGAGRKATEEMSFSEIDGDFRAYRILRHQHTPEIDRAL
ncbi:MAG TPA: N-acetyl-gamma-glutamyl-phosphate reductase, partial [Polyangia bacterium]|nr:N-acetyl-gamma-glutamyl-phosphate reductase [Polyangia bacterium]